MPIDPKRRANNRARFPEFTRFVDAVRKAFGDDVKVVWAWEKGRVVGKVPARAKIQQTLHP